MLARFALCLLLGTAFASAWAQPDPAAKKAELRELRDRIDALRKDLAKSEANRSEAADSLREAEKAISDSNRQLRELAQARAELRRELGALEAQADRLEGQIGTQQRQIGALLYRQHLQGRNIDDDALKLLLAGENPNQVARDYHYLKLLSHAKTEVVEDLRDALAQKQKLADAVRDKTDKLAANEKQQQAERQTLLAQQKQRQTVLAGIADKVKNQRRQIATLKQNEQRLSKLIDGLTRLVAKARRPTARPATPGAPGLRNEREPDAGLSGAFAALRGRLSLPVRGEVANRFGAPRAEGTSWKGLFIRAAEGSEVKSIAAGQVVFADWLRGFGNLIIVDHGDGYLTIYGNNESLFRQTGDNVKSGEAIASVGNSGGNPESGLYFELRHQGQVLDPLKWVRLH